MFHDDWTESCFILILAEYISIVGAGLPAENVYANCVNIFRREASVNFANAMVSMTEKLALEIQTK